MASRPVPATALSGFGLQKLTFGVKNLSLRGLKFWNGAAVHHILPYGVAMQA